VFTQSQQDNEDENMEEGVKLITNILGPDNIQLYPNILQLVMADGAYTEGRSFAGLVWCWDSVHCVE